MKTKTIVLISAGLGIWWIMSQAAKKTAQITAKRDSDMMALQGIHGDVDIWEGQEHIDGLEGFGSSFKKVVHKVSKPVTKAVKTVQKKVIRPVIGKKNYDMVSKYTKKVAGPLAWVAPIAAVPFILDKDTRKSVAPALTAYSIAAGAAGAGALAAGAPIIGGGGATVAGGAGTVGTAGAAGGSIISDFGSDAVEQGVDLYSQFNAPDVEPVQEQPSFDNVGQPDAEPDWFQKIILDLNKVF